MKRKARPKSSEELEVLCKDALPLTREDYLCTRKSYCRHKRTPQVICGKHQDAYYRIYKNANNT